MSEERVMLTETVERLLAAARGGADASAETGALDAALWRQLEELGLPALLVPEARGGAGGGFEDACAVARALGRFAAPVPLCETLLAARLLAEAGLECPPGALTLAPHGAGALSSERFTGVLEGVPWGADASGVATLVVPGRLVLVHPAAASETLRGANLADEPRDRLRFDAAPALTASVEADAAAKTFEHAALLRTAQMAGALAAALERSLAHASQRRQFGKTLSQFQAVQQLLAVMGEEVLAVDCAVRAAARAADRGDAAFEIACAKLRANLAAGRCAAGAHQVHGALGFTREQDLRLYTQRLLAWRSEHGHDLFWSARLGGQVAARGADAFWPDLTARA